jgi:hypothetical protein
MPAAGPAVRADRQRRSRGWRATAGAVTPDASMERATRIEPATSSIGKLLVPKLCRDVAYYKSRLAVT